MKKVYNNETLDKMRIMFEEEFREQYEISCKNSHLEWQKKFKHCFEDVYKALYQLDKLIK